MKGLGTINMTKAADKSAGTILAAMTLPTIQLPCSECAKSAIVGAENFLAGLYHGASLGRRRRSIAD